jgi:adenylate cyclase
MRARSSTAPRRLRRIVERLESLAAVGALPEDSGDERLRKATLTLSAALITALSCAWTITYLALGLRVSASIPLVYQVASTASLIHFAKTKRFAFFRSSQLLMMLALPFLLQWSLGGFAASSSVTLWGLIAPLGAMMYLGPRPAVPWFVGFLALLVVSVLADPYLARHAAEVPNGIRTAFSAMNLAAVSLTAYVLLQYFVRQRDRARQALDQEHALLVGEQEKSELLLLNVLPEAIARRLKDGEGVIADGFGEVTVLFADIVDFTPLSQRLSPERLVGLLNDLFTAFDALAAERGLEKIKTIGDAYMVVAGVPDPRPDHAEAMASMALAMLEEVEHPLANGEVLSLRIGMDTGPVVAGVIGRRRFIYDLWGDTVNTASRMESHGVPGRIQVTARVEERLRDVFAFEARPKIRVKGKGEMTTFFLTGRASPSPSSPSRPEPDHDVFDGPDRLATGAGERSTP